MELFCKEEVCMIVKEFVKKFMRWDGYINDEKMLEDIWESFIEDEDNQKIKFKRLIDTEEINVEDLDDYSTA